MHLEWAQDWLSEFEEGFVHMRGFYADEFEFEDVPTGHRATTFAEMEAFLSPFLEGGGTQRFVARAYRGDARGGVVEWTWYGEHGADVAGLPLSGSSTVVEGCSAFAFDGRGKIVVERDFWDLATLLRQVGALPPPAA
jgi:steroid delta-isomerase-like uncharacterized protein